MSIFRFGLLILLITSCASTKEVVKGYSGPKLDKMIAKIHRKTPKEALKILGVPAVAGICTNCGHGSIYRFVYPTKDMRRMHLNITANTDEEIDCVVFDFLPNKKEKKYYFDKKTGVKFMMNCNNPGGAILDLKAHLDEAPKK